MNQAGISMYLRLVFVFPEGAGAFMPLIPADRLLAFRPGPFLHIYVLSNLDPCFFLGYSSSVDCRKTETQLRPTTQSAHPNRPWTIRHYPEAIFSETMPSIVE
jgi:hypothetical protein